MVIVGASNELRRLKIRLDVLRRIRPGVECPVCGNHLWFWKIPRNAGTFELQCRRCGSMQRQRRTLLFLRRQTNLYRTSRGPLRLLHVAPDAQLHAELKSLPNLECISGDLVEDKVDVQLDLTSMAFPDGSFDVIICSHVLEHIPNDRKAISEMRRVLRPGGWALINVPSHPSLKHSYEDDSITTRAGRLAAFGQDDHVRIYSAGDVLARLRTAGFDVIVDPLLVSADERRRYLLDGDGKWEHGYLCRPA